MPEKFNYLGGSTIILSGSSVAVSLPSIIPQAMMIRAEGGAVYFEVNSDTSSADANSSGYIPDGILDIIPDILNLETLHIFGGTGISSFKIF